MLTLDVSEALGAHVKAEVDKWVPVIKAAGVTAN